MYQWVSYLVSEYDVIKNESVVKNDDKLWFCVHDLDIILDIITEKYWNLSLQIIIKYKIKTSLQSELTVDINKLIVSSSIIFVRFHCKIPATTVWAIILWHP